MVAPQTLMLSTRLGAFHAQLYATSAQAVFVHGLGGNLDDWEPLCALLGERIGALTYDLRGCGESVGQTGELFDHSEDLLAVLDAAAVQRCNLIGISLGGGVALNFALNHPQRVANLVLISPAIVGWEWSEEWRALWQPILDLARAGSMEQAKQAYWQHPLFRTTRESAAAPLLHESIMRYSGAQWLRDDHKLVLPDVERLHELQTRTLLLSGALDVDDLQLIANLIEASAPSVQRRDFAACGHLISLEDPAGCAAAIMEFLAAETNN
jgi:pimeloyl-ACP methyl ester carboxylesterase